MSPRARNTTSGRRWLLWLVLLALCGRPAYLHAATDDDRRSELVATVTAGMERHEVPGVSIALIEKYEILWADGFGLLAATRDDRVRPTSLFQAASISKPITALATMKMVEQGQLDLNEDVNRRLKSWHVPDSPLLADRPVTLRRLLSHTAGLTVHGFPGYAAGEQVPTLVQILDGAKPANTRPIQVDIKPSYMFRYSGGGYCVAQQLLIDITGLPFAEFMKRQVLEPLGMEQSSYEQPLNPALVSRAAVGHRAHKKVVEGNYHTYPEMAAAGLWTTPSDLALALIDLARSITEGKGKLLTQSTATEMLKIEKGKMGLGLVITGEGSKLSLGHGGANEGYRCDMICFPSTGQGLVIMTNSDTGGAMFDDVHKTAARVYAWPKQD